MGDVLIMKNIVKRGHLYSLVFMAILAGSLIGYSRYEEVPPQVSELFMAIGAMMILFAVLSIVIYLIYFLTSLVFGAIITVVLKINNKRKDNGID